MWCCEAEREERRRADSRVVDIEETVSTLKSEANDNVRFRPVGMSVDIDPFFVGRGVCANAGDCTVGVVDWEFPPLLRE